jgi:hypothetical protein
LEISLLKYWSNLSWNTHPDAILILKQNQDKIDWRELSMNPGIFEETLDKEGLKKRMDIIREELLIKAMRPSRLSQIDAFDQDDES